MIATLQKPTIENDGSSFVDMDSIPKIVSKSGPQKPRTGIILALVVLVLISAGGLTYWVLAKTSASSTAGSPSVAVPTATAVRIFVVGSRNSKPASQSLTGVIRARHEVQLAFRVGGKINKRHVEVGQVVAKGDLLFELEPEDFDLQVQTARANLEVAKAAVQRWIAEEKRLQELLRINAVSPSEYEKGLADRDSALGLRQSAEKQLELATNQLGYCRLVADESGVMTSIEVEAGQVVAAGARLGSLAQTNELEAVIDVPENRLPSLVRNETKVEFWSMPGFSLPAKLREVSPIADVTTRTFRARFTLLQPSEKIKLGMTASVSLPEEDHRAGVEIPLTSIMSHDGKPSVWLLDSSESSISSRPITVEKFSDDHAFVLEGLKAGDKIVSAGVQKLDVGMSVRVWEIQP